jgi:hypothetical protein
MSTPVINMITRTLRRSSRKSRPAGGPRYSTNCCITSLADLKQQAADVEAGISFLNTKNATMRVAEMTPRMHALLASLPRAPVWVFTSPRTGRRYNNIDKVFKRALDRAKTTQARPGQN